MKSNQVDFFVDVSFFWAWVIQRARVVNKMGIKLIGNWNSFFSIYAIKNIFRQA